MGAPEGPESGSNRPPSARIRSEVGHGGTLRQQEAEVSSAAQGTDVRPSEPCEATSGSQEVPSPELAPKMYPKENYSGPSVRAFPYSPDSCAVDEPPCWCRVAVVAAHRTGGLRTTLPPAVHRKREPGTDTHVPTQKGSSQCKPVHALLRHSDIKALEVGTLRTKTRLNRIRADGIETAWCKNPCEHACSHLHTCILCSAKRGVFPSAC